MRVLRGAVLLLGLAGGLSAGQTPPGPCQTPGEFENRLAAWTASGVRRYAETGSALSECLVADDDRFFRRMLEQPKVYDAWLQSLGSNTFTVLDPSQRPRLVELKTQMTEIAVRRSGDPSYGALAKTLSEQLAKTEVVDLDAGIYVLPAGNRVYVFTYGTNTDKSISRFTGPVEDVLERFVEDFEVLKPAAASNTSKSKS